MRTCLLALGLTHFGWTSLPAQQNARSFDRWEPPAVLVVSPLYTPPEESPSIGDYRYEGLVFGGVVFGALGAYLGSRVSGACPLEPGIRCESDQLGQAVALGLVGAGLGGGLGYLVGRFSPKKHPAMLEETAQPARHLAGIPDSVRKRSGYQHWRGAALGTAIGGGVGALAGVILGTLGGCYDCNQPNPAEGALIVGLLGAGTGSVVGFLAGLASPKYVWVPAAGLPVQ